MRGNAFFCLRAIEAVSPDCLPLAGTWRNKVLFLAVRVHTASSVSRHCLKSARKRVLARGRFGACFFHGGGRQLPAQYARLSYQRWPFEVGKLKANECPLWFCVVRGIAWHASTTSSVLAAARHTDYCPVILDKEDVRFPNYGLNKKAEVAFWVKYLRILGPGLAQYLAVSDQCTAVFFAMLLWY